MQEDGNATVLKLGVSFSFYFLPNLPLALKSFLSLPPCRGCLPSLFSSLLMPYQQNVVLLSLCPQASRALLSHLRGAACPAAGRRANHMPRTGPWVLPRRRCSWLGSSWGLRGNGLVHGLKRISEQRKMNSLTGHSGLFWEAR